MYATLAQLEADYSEALLIRVTNFEGEAFTEINETRAEQALTDASQSMDGYLQGRYTTPFPNPPAWFKTANEAIAVKILVERKGYNAGTPDESLILTAKDYIKQFEQVSQGKMDLPDPDSEESATSPDATFISSAPVKKFDDDTMDTY
jgi:phage gp36-like protein